MKKWLFLIILTLLFIFPGSCFAENAPPHDQPQKPQPSFYCSYAKVLAESYALNIKEKYANKEIDDNYIIARHKYQVAAAKFAGLRSSIELDIFVGKHIPNINGSKYETAIEEAYAAFLDFEQHAQAVLGVTKFYRFDPTPVSAIIEVVDKAIELWLKYKDNQKERLCKLQTWIADYLQWTGWEDISATKPAVPAEPKPKCPEPKPNSDNTKPAS